MIAASLPRTTSTTSTATLPRPAATSRWLSLLSGLLMARSSTEWVEVPAALAVQPSARAQRLMRNARCGGW